MSALIGSSAASLIIVEAPYFHGWLTEKAYWFLVLFASPFFTRRKSTRHTQSFFLLTRMLLAPFFMYHYSVSSQK